ncbi:unnamed protein product [Kuraishia capsulata CBS 1993]|uniref:Uncharacterized protein n=1 Tax=Kuraishia capsulata CBS 1993 TaxID=1382522 RepID=W6MQF4_9ASCO|nr:uncharacterized protein KUCA_T00004975001 [Kuraishia capsulata CBS 1993]CDK28989.1 unnamed protein product [Kuraishia capsulata CBS 1993]
MTVSSALKRTILRPVNSSDVALGGAVFDMDGTLCLPQMASLSGEQKRAAELKIEQVEEKAMNEMIPQKGLSNLFAFLNDSNVPLTICTRNQIVSQIFFSATFASTNGLETCQTFAQELLARRNAH